MIRQRTNIPLHVECIRSTLISTRRRYVDRIIDKLTMKVNVRMVSQKERWDVLILLMPQFYSSMSVGAVFLFCFVMADMMDGRNNAPGRLERMKYARINTATLKLAAMESPATFDIKKVNDSSCNPYPLMETGTNVIK